MFTSLKTSAPWKTKLMCVLKKGVLRITMQDFRTQLWLGEVSGHPMEHMPLLISEVSKRGEVCFVFVWGGRGYVWTWKC